MHCFSLYDFKASQMNIQHCLIWEFMLFEFEMYCNAAVATKKICCVKGEGLVDYSTVTRWFKKFNSGCKNLNNQAKQGRSKAIDSKFMFRAIEANPESST